jgi:IclR family pca regulon transcriptional regulator
VGDRAALADAIGTAHRQGWAAVDQELEEGLRSIAVPIRDAGGQVVAAMNVSTHAGRTSMGELRDAMLPILLDASARIGAGLRGPEGAPATGRRAVRADAQEA